MTAGDLAGAALNALAAATGAGAVAAVTTRTARDRRLGTARGLGIWAAVRALQGHWLDAASVAAVIAVLLGWDWWDRRGRKVAKAIGSKSRAALAAVVARAREAGTPLPEGVRA